MSKISIEELKLMVDVLMINEAVSSAQIRTLTTSLNVLATSVLSPDGMDHFEKAYFGNLGSMIQASLDNLDGQVDPEMLQKTRDEALDSIKQGSRFVRKN